MHVDGRPVRSTTRDIRDYERRLSDVVSYVQMTALKARPQKVIGGSPPSPGSESGDPGPCSSSDSPALCANIE